MKVGLFLSVYPEFDNSNRQAPLGLGYLVAYAKQHVGGIDFVVERDIDALIAAKPDLVGFSMLTKMASHSIRHARKVKDALGCPIICGGPHPSLLPAAMDPVFDLAVLGEGEITFAELMRLYKEEGRFSPQSLAKVKGIAYRDETGQIIKTEPRPFIDDLDTLPFPDRALICGKWPHTGREYTIMTSRGCPYNCSFCSTTLHWGRKYRFHSKEYVCREIESIRREYNPILMKIWDDLFIANRKRTLELLELIRQRRLHEGMEFTCFVRANLLDDEMMDSLARTNFKILNIGFESSSDAVLDTLNKEGVDAEVCRRAAELARRHGLQFSSTFIIGAPGETRDDILATFEFVTSNQDVFSYAEFVPLEILPGTKVWDWAGEKGVSATNLRGVIFEPEDLKDRRGFYMERWPYFNEDNVSRAELYSLLQVGDQIMKMVMRNAELRRQNLALKTENQCVQTADHVAATISFTDILRAKVKRRFSR